MISLLGLRLEDTSAKEFTDALKLKTLNNAQLKLANLLHNSYLTELQELQASLTFTSGVYSISTLYSSYGHRVLRGEQGLLKAKIENDLYCTKIVVRDLKRTENALLAGTLRNPLFWVFQNKIYISNSQTNPEVDIWYLRTPWTMYYKQAISVAGTPSTTTFLGDSGEGFSTSDTAYTGAILYSIAEDSYHKVTSYDAAGNGEGERFFTVTPVAGSNFGTDEIYFISRSYDELDNLKAAGETCQLNPSLHELVVSLAEAECWALNAELERSNEVTKAAMNEIATLNKRYNRTAGIGTQGDERRTA